MPVPENNGPTRTIQRAEPGGSLPWLCVWTRPNQERRAEEELENQGFPVFLPLFERRLPNRHIRIEPLFNRYLFAQPVNGLWAPIRGTRGVSDVLRDPEGHPRWVSGHEIERLLNRVSPGHKPIQKGTAATLLSGPFATFTAVVIEDAGDRIRMMLSIFGRSIEQWFQPEDIEVIA